MADVERRMDEEKLRMKSRLEERLNKIRKERIDVGFVQKTMLIL